MGRFGSGCRCIVGDVVVDGVEEGGGREREKTACDARMHTYRQQTEGHSPNKLEDGNARGRHGCRRVGGAASVVKAAEADG